MNASLAASKNPRLGILLMVLTVAIFAIQDGFSRSLAEAYNTPMVVMIRYWVFASFVIFMATRRPEGFRAAVSSKQLPAHFLRGVLLVVEICFMMLAYTMIGLIETHAIFAICPLMVVALSGPILGERMSWQRWAAVAAGLLGMLVILRPGAGVFSWASLLPFGAALLFALYSVLSRLTTRSEPTFPSLFWPAVLGAVLMTFVGMPSLEPVSPQYILPLALYCGMSILSHWLLLKTYEQIQAAQVQPYAYLQIVFASVIGMLFFGEVLALPIVIGAGIIVMAGLFALSQERRT
ncbi:DMT family transporter [Xinfangfangia sp. CPCC 101601]|uniref:DMT family transporter n=1 Tax=Pseudogemmobacter lacusdianii TaxID=3069608 RepID=A0ABU0VXG9_9RHOB|nr:DMT family transporter [Xinfangfangia sp. CPCC 101601]MDQ2066456.1 DMT family transporter [Xinfangfangia sp. CPCC 101601]